MGGHLDLNAHSRVCQSRRNHHGSRPHIAKILPKNRPTIRKFAGLWENIHNPNHITKAGPSLLKGGLDVAQTLFSLFNQTIPDSHRLIVKACRSRNEDPISVNDRSGIAYLLLER
jgi:hypothetical protein